MAYDDLNNASVSNACDTSNPYLKYRILAKVMDNPPAGKLRLALQVQAWRTNEGYTTSRDGTCWIRISSQTGVYIHESNQGFSYSNTKISQYSYTPIYSAASSSEGYIDIDTSGIVSDGLAIEAKVQFNATTSGKAYTSSWQGFVVDISSASLNPVLSTTITDIESTSMKITVNSSVNCDSWWYTVLNMDGTVYINWTEFSTVDATSRVATITGLAQNTMYGISCMAYKTGDHTHYGIAERAYDRTTFNLPDPLGRITIFDRMSTNFATNGLGTLIEAISCTITEERNGAYELEMEYPVAGSHFNDIDHKSILVAKPGPDRKPQPFRIYAISKPINGIVTINAEHLSYDLMGYVASPFNGSTAANAMYNMKTSCAVTCPFEFWTDITTEKDISTTKPLPIKTIIGGDTNSILSLYSFNEGTSESPQPDQTGELEYDCYHVKLWKHRGEDHGFESDEIIRIRYGKNLTDFKQDENCNNIYSAIHPYWYKEETKDGNKSYKLVELDSKIVAVYDLLPEALKNNQQYVRYILTINRTLALDLSKEFDDEPTKAQLLEKTVEYVWKNELAVPKVSMNVSFVSLERYKEYELIKKLQVVRLCDTIVVDFPKIGVSREAKCVKTVYNVLSQQYDSIELGTVESYIYTGRLLSDTISNQLRALSATVDQEQLANAMANS